MMATNYPSGQYWWFIAMITKGKAAIWQTHCHRWSHYQKTKEPKMAQQPKEKVGYNYKKEHGPL